MFFPLIFIKAFYSVKNGQEIKLEHYTLKLPFPEWILVQKNDVISLVSAGKINEQNVFAEIATNYRNVNMEYLLKGCEGDIELLNRTYKYMSGKSYICKDINETDVMYFLSDDNYFFLRVDPYYTDKDITESYDRLLNSVDILP